MDLLLSLLNLVAFSDHKELLPFFHFVNRNSFFASFILPGWLGVGQKQQTINQIKLITDQ